MPRYLTRRRLSAVFLALALALASACGTTRADYATHETAQESSRSSQAHQPESYSDSEAAYPISRSSDSKKSSSWFSFGDEQIDGAMVAPSGSTPPSPPAPPAQQSGGADGRAQSGGDPSEAQKPEPQAQSPKGRPLLIYNGSLVVAIYEVAETQLKAIAIVEDAEGFVASRASDRLILRVPAAKFREILDQLANLGDLIDVNWRAQDVSEEVRDLQIRLQNSMEIRNRLQQLLARAEKVEDALAIEAQLERVTLDIERIIGQLRSFQDRVAFSTIDMQFRAKRVDEIPDDEYLLPYSWLNGLGVDNLLRIPRGRQ